MGKLNMKYKGQDLMLIVIYSKNSHLKVIVLVNCQYRQIFINEWLNCISNWNCNSIFRAVVNK